MAGRPARTLRSGWAAQSQWRASTATGIRRCRRASVRRCPDGAVHRRYGSGGCRPVRLSHGLGQSNSQFGRADAVGSRRPDLYGDRIGPAATTPADGFEFTAVNTGAGAIVARSLMPGTIAQDPSQSAPLIHPESPGVAGQRSPGSWALDNAIGAVVSRHPPSSRCDLRRTPGCRQGLLRAVRADSGLI